jgi:predicted metal-dependent peptidase
MDGQGQLKVHGRLKDDRKKDERKKDDRKKKERREKERNQNVIKPSVAVDASGSKLEQASK